MIRARRGRARPTDGYRSKLERDYALNLTARLRIGDIEWWGYECLKLRLGEGAWFTGDFIVLRSDGGMELHECKGMMRESANVRLKVAASLYPWLPVYVVYAQARGGGFRIEEVAVGPVPKEA